MKASACKCVECGKPAVAFWPVIDPDIPAHPYCRECLDKAKMELIVKLEEINRRNEKIREKKNKRKGFHYPRGC